MKLAKYIHELLLENETVIFPGFGAFISNYKPAEIRENEIIPPSKVISFTRQFRNDDGLLVTIIARKAKISQTNALKRIDRERENMMYLLDKGEKVTIENIGVLFNNEKNEIQFAPFQDENPLLDTFGFEPVTTEDTVEKTLVTETEEILNKSVEPANEDEVENESTSEKPIEKIILPRTLPDWAIEKPVERKKTGWYWYLLILLPILIVGYFLFLNSNNQNKTEINDQTTNNELEQIQIQTIVPSDSIQNDSIQKLKTDSVVNVKPDSGTSLDNSKYYLIGGGFKSEENAEKYILRLKEKGIEGTMIGKKGSMYLVGIASFDSKQEAFNALNENLKTYPEWNLWIHKK